MPVVDLPDNAAALQLKHAQDGAQRQADSIMVSMANARDVFSLSIGSALAGGGRIMTEAGGGAARNLQASGVVPPPITPHA